MRHNQRVADLLQIQQHSIVVEDCADRCRLCGALPKPMLYDHLDEQHQIAHKVFDTERLRSVKLESLYNSKAYHEVICELIYSS